MLGLVKNLGTAELKDLGKRLVKPGGYRYHAISHPVKYHTYPPRRAWSLGSRKQEKFFGGRHFSLPANAIAARVEAMPREEQRGEK